MGTVFNRRLINENSKKDKDLATTVQGLDTRVTALEQGGGGGGSTTLEAVTLPVSLVVPATGSTATAPTDYTGTGVTIIHDGTRILGANFSVIGTPMTSDYADFFKGAQIVLDNTGLSEGDLPIGGYTGVATAEEVMSAKDNGTVIYKIYVGTAGADDNTPFVTVQIVDLIKNGTGVVNGIIY